GAQPYGLARLRRRRQIGEGRAPQHAIENVSQNAPQRTDRAVPEMHTARVRSVVLVAETGREERPAQSLQGIGERDLLGRPGEHVAATASAHALDQSALAEVAHELSRVRNGQALLLGDDADRERLGLAMASQLEQATKSVFFL